MSIEEDRDFFSLPKNFNQNQLVSAYKRLYLEFHPKATVRQNEDDTMPDISQHAKGNFVWEFGDDEDKLSDVVHESKSVDENMDEDSMFDKVNQTFQRLKSDLEYRLANPQEEEPTETVNRFYEMIDGSNLVVGLPPEAKEGGILYLMVDGNEVVIPIEDTNENVIEKDIAFGKVKIEFG